MNIFHKKKNQEKNKFMKNIKFSYNQKKFIFFFNCHNFLEKKLILCDK
jgi:hypothetical protein